MKLKSVYLSQVLTNPGTSEPLRYINIVIEDDMKKNVIVDESLSLLGFSTNVDSTVESFDDVSQEAKASLEGKDDSFYQDPNVTTTSNPLPQPGEIIWYQAESDGS